MLEMKTVYPLHVQLAERYVYPIPVFNLRWKEKKKKLIILNFSRWSYCIPSGMQFSRQWWPPSGVCIIKSNQIKSNLRL